MLTFVTFALSHNTLVTVLYFLFIGMSRKYGSVHPGSKIEELILVGTTGVLISSFFDVTVTALGFYLFFLLFVTSKTHLIFPTWAEVYRKFYSYLILTMILYLLYKLVFLGNNLISTAYFHNSRASVENLGFIPSTLIGQLFFIFLLLSETFVLVSSAYAIYDSLSLMADKAWKERPAGNDKYPNRKGFFPMVSFHIPICREPPEMVIETLMALTQVEYPDFEVIVISNNTKEEALWRPVEHACKRFGFKFLHHEILPGYKAGALNRGLVETHERAQLVCILDSDYRVKPGFLKRVVPLFQDPETAFVQTAQDYRNRDETLLQRLGYPVYKLFFDVVMVARDRRNSIMFAGTMGLLRKEVLHQIGGWNEQCVAEDAEASLRMLNLGYKGIYLHETWGYGLLPTEFSGCEKQWSRWMTGGIQVVRLNWKILLNPQSRLTFAQRWDYAVGGVMSFGAFLTINSALLLAGFALLITVTPGLIQPIFASFSTSMFIFSFFITLTAMMVILIFKWNMNYSSKRSFGAFIFVMGLSWARAQAVWLALTRKTLVFERTAKFRTNPTYIRLLWHSRSQITMVVLIILLNLIILQNYQTHPAGLIIISFWQEVTYLSGVALSVLSIRRS